MCSTERSTRRLRPAHAPDRCDVADEVLRHWVRRRRTLAPCSCTRDTSGAYPLNVHPTCRVHIGGWVGGWMGPTGDHVLFAPRRRDRGGRASRARQRVRGRVTEGRPAGRRRRTRSPTRSPPPAHRPPSCTRHLRCERAECAPEVSRSHLPLLPGGALRLTRGTRTAWCSRRTSSRCSSVPTSARVGVTSRPSPGRSASPDQTCTRWSGRSPVTAAASALVRSGRCSRRCGDRADAGDSAAEAAGTATAAADRARAERTLVHALPATSRPDR